MKLKIGYVSQQEDPRTIESIRNAIGMRSS
jgi:hypothetical protein